MAVVDLETKKIFGCKEGSRVHWHELGHLQFNSKKLGVTINYYGQLFQMVSLFFISVGVLTNNLFSKSLGFVTALGMFCCYAFEEVWCWIYSFKNYKKISVPVSNPVNHKPNS